MDQQLKTWAENLLNEVDLEWEKHKMLSEYGYAVFYSPISQNPEMMIIGINPGGGAGNFDRAQSKSLPESHSYLRETYPLATKTNRIFSRCPELLEKSVKLNLLFFRTPTFKDWEKLGAGTEEGVKVCRALEDFCKAKVVEIINRLKPKVILCEGITTFDRLVQLLHAEEIEKPVTSPTKKGERRIFVKARHNSTSILGILHLSSKFTRPTDHEVELIKANLEKAIGI